MEESTKLQNAIRDFARNTLINNDDIIRFISVIQKYSISSFGKEEAVNRMEDEIYNIITSDVSEGSNIVSELYLHIILNGVDVGKIINTFYSNHSVETINPKSFIESKSKLILVAIAIKLFNNMLLLELITKDKK
jgi:hypothetical protein